MATAVSLDHTVKPTADFKTSIQLLQRRYIRIIPCLPTSYRCPSQYYPYPAHANYPMYPLFWHMLAILGRLPTHISSRHVSWRDDRRSYPLTTYPSHAKPTGRYNSTLSHHQWWRNSTRRM